MPLLLGSTLALLLGLSARLLHFDRDRSFYPTLLVVFAGYYVLFAVMAGEALIPELVAATAFLGLAVVAHRGPSWVAGAGLVAHGLFDGVHHLLITNPGVPEWWPPFCGSVDVVLGLWVLAMGVFSPPAPSPPASPRPSPTPS